MDIIGGVKEGAETGGKIGLWAGLALGVACGLVATAVIFAFGGIALPWVALTMHGVHSTLLALGQVIGGSAISMAVCSAVGAVGGWLTGIIGGATIGGAAGLFKSPESKDIAAAGNQQSLSRGAWTE